MLEVMPDGHWQPSAESLCSREDDKAEDVNNFFKTLLVSFFFLSTLLNFCNSRGRFWNRAKFRGLGRTFGISGEFLFLLFFSKLKTSLIFYKKSNHVNCVSKFTKIVEWFWSCCADRYKNYIAFGKPSIRMLYTWIASQMWDSVKILIPPSSSDKNLKKIDDV